MTSADRSVALVTGATRNIGLAIARRLAADGMLVAVGGPDREPCESAAEELRAGGGEAVALPFDVADGAATRSAIAGLAERHGRLDVLVANAAVPLVGRVPFLELDPDDLDRAFAINARGVVLCAQAAARAMRPARRGAIVAVSSIGATRAHRSAVAYDATKGAVEAATRAMALDLAPFGIRVNAVAPAAVATDRSAPPTSAGGRRLTSEVPLGRIGTGEDVAAVVAFLAGAGAAHVTGQVLAVDGGMSAQARPPAAEPSAPPPSGTAPSPGGRPSPHRPAHEGSA